MSFHFRFARALARNTGMLRRDLQRVSQSCGVNHPAMVTTAHMELLEGLRSTSVRDVFSYDPTWGLPGAEDLRELGKLLSEHAAT